MLSPVRSKVAQILLHPVNVLIIEADWLEEAAVEEALAGPLLTKVEVSADFWPYALPPSACGVQPDPIIPI